MKKILSVALLISSISLTSFAQEIPKKDVHIDRKRAELVDKTAEEIAKKRTDHIDKEVHLTEKQRKEVYSLYFNEAKAKIEAEEKASQNGGVQSKKVKKDASDDVHKLLTPEQKKVLADKKNKSNGQKSGNSQGQKKTEKKPGN